MRAAQTTLRRPALLLPRRAERPRRECAGTAHSGAVWLFGTMFLAGYLPGIWLGRGGVSALGQQLAAYYTKSPENAAFAAIFRTEFCCGAPCELRFVGRASGSRRTARPRWQR